MIQRLRRNSPYNNYGGLRPISTYSCNQNDLAELNAMYVDNSPDGSKAFIIGTSNYYRLDKQLGEWVLVTDIPTATEEESNSIKYQINKFRNEITEIEMALLTTLEEMYEDIELTQMNILSTLEELLSQ